MIYFIQQGKSGPIKIGYTGNNDISKRMETIQIYAPEKLTLLGYIEGDQGQEKLLHQLFHSYRLNGEWFEPVPPIINHIMGLIFGVHFSDTYFQSDTPVSLDDFLEFQERRGIEYALKKSNNNICKAAETLGISYRSLRHRISKYKTK